MRPEWHELPNNDVSPQAAALRATLTPRGVFTLNKRTWTEMDEPEAVIILFDPVNNRIGLKPTTPSTRNAYRIGHFNRNHSKRIRAARLIAEYRLDLPETLEFRNVTTDENGILILDLRTAKISARAAARRQEWASNPKRKRRVTGQGENIA